MIKIALTMKLLNLTMTIVKIFVNNEIVKFNNHIVKKKFRRKNGHPSKKEMKFRCLTSNVACLNVIAFLNFSSDLKVTK